MNNRSRSRRSWSTGTSNPRPPPSARSRDAAPGTARSQHPARAALPSSARVPSVQARSASRRATIWSRSVGGFHHRVRAQLEQDRSQLAFVRDRDRDLVPAVVARPDVFGAHQAAVAHQVMSGESAIVARSSPAAVHGPAEIRSAARNPSGGSLPSPRVGEVGGEPRQTERSRLVTLVVEPHQVPIAGTEQRRVHVDVPFRSGALGCSIPESNPPMVLRRRSDRHDQRPACVRTRGERPSGQAGQHAPLGSHHQFPHRLLGRGIVANTLRSNE